MKFYTVANTIAEQQGRVSRNAAGMSAPKPPHDMAVVNGHLVPLKDVQSIKDCIEAGDRRYAAECDRNTIARALDNTAESLKNGTAVITGCKAGGGSAMACAVTAAATAAVSAMQKSFEALPKRPNPDKCLEGYPKAPK